MQSNGLNSCFSLPGGESVSEIDVVIPGVGTRKLHASVAAEYDTLRDALKEEEERHHRSSYDRLPERLAGVLQMHRRAAEDAINGARDFRDDFLVMLRSIAFVVETAMSASTHGEKNARLRGVAEVIERHVNDLRQMSFDFSGRMWERGYDAFRWNRNEQWLRERVRELEEKVVSKRKRFSGVDPQTTLPCSQCGEVKPTTISEVWCGADPSGRLVRVCQDCTVGFAAG